MSMTHEFGCALYPIVLAAALVLPTHAAFAWGDEGHEVVGQIAERYLKPDVRARINSLLMQDTSGLTSIDLPHETTWADKYRDSDRDGAKIRYLATREWHYVDLELDGADVHRACFGQPRLAVGARASAGPADDCVIDKIEEFAAELKSPATDAFERVLALQFLLHLVGDLHQPLHASDDHDQGGNKKIASAPGIGPNTLHHDWDTEFVARLGGNATEIAAKLIAELTPAQVSQWSSGTAKDWALESYSVGKIHTYGMLPAPLDRNRYELSSTYVIDATTVTAEQLSKAGVRLAFVLNESL